MPEEVAGVMNQRATSLAPQNTGVSSFDAHVDRVIGSSSQEGWEYQEKRDAIKRSVLQANPGARREDLSAVGEGDWEIMPKPLTEKVKRARTINALAMQSGRYLVDGKPSKRSRNPSGGGE